MKFKNNNKEIIKRITKKSLKTNKIRNIFAVFAIILTTFMIFSVFSIGTSYAKNFNTMSLRLKGTTSTISLNNPTNNQINEIKDLGITKDIGSSIYIGSAQNNILKENKTNVNLMYQDEISFENQITPCIGEIKGTYPIKYNEIMISTEAIKYLELEDVKLNDEIKIKYTINDKEENKTFKITGIYEDFKLSESHAQILMSKEFVEDNKLTIKDNGILNLTLISKKRDIAKDSLEENIKLDKKQEFIYKYDVSKENEQTTLISIGLIGMICSFIVISGYLLIYNVMYISVIRDINFYGLLKTIGTSPTQIRMIVRGQILRLSIIAIPIGMTLGLLVSFGMVPMAMEGIATNAYSTIMPSTISLNPIIFIGTILFSLFAVSISSNKPAKIASKVSPTDALRYIETKPSKNKKTRKTTNGGKIHKMAFYNVFRDKKRASIVFLSLFMGIMTFLSVSSFLNSIDVDNYVDRYLYSDFSIQNLEVGEKGEEKLSNKVIDEMKSINGITKFNEVKLSKLQIDMNEDLLLPPLEVAHERWVENPKEELNKLLDDIKKDPKMLTDYIIGIDYEILEEFNERYDKDIDIEAFKNGELALVDSYFYPSDINIGNEKLTLSNDDNKITFEAQIFKNEEMFLPSGKEEILGIPRIYVSLSTLEKLDKTPINYLLRIDVEEDKEKGINQKLKDITSNIGLWFEAKSDITKEFENSQMMMNILGNGISIILILIGILNFINVMITGVNVRIKELSIMESVGMTRKQIKKMLTLEGFYYASLTSILILTIGTSIIYFMSKLTKQVVDYANFTFPTSELVTIIIIIFVICLITPSKVYKILTKKTITERLRETTK